MKKKLPLVSIFIHTEVSYKLIKLIKLVSK